MNEPDEIRLRHMLDAARAARSFVLGRTREELKSDLMFAFGLVKAIEIIGEAAVKMSPEGREIYSQIPWKNIIGMRNKIVHDYFDIDYDVVWETVETRLPELIVELEKIVSDESA